MTGEKDISKLKKTKLTKGKLKAFLVNKYDGSFVDKILRVIDVFRLNKEGLCSFDEYCNFISDLINFQTDQLFQMAFKIYDYNGNEQICELDIVSFLKIQDGGEDLDRVYMSDINLIIKKLRDKTTFKGCQNRDMDVALAKIYKRAGVLNQFYVGDRDNPNQPPIKVDTPPGREKLDLFRAL
jgi:Ca2+-binding EF-hand superfamily protein